MGPFIFPARSEDSNPVYVYFTRMRERRQHSQATHVFVSCVVHPDPGGVHVSLEQRSLGLWRFQTVWDLSKAALRSRFEQVHVQMMRFSPVGAGSFLLQTSDEGAESIWPGVLKRRRAPADGPPVDGPQPEQERKPGRARTAGIKVNLPIVALAGLEGFDAAVDSEMPGEVGLAADMELDDSDDDDDEQEVSSEVMQRVQIAVGRSPLGLVG